MANEPTITVIGNIVADPEPRTSQAGKPWVTFRMASTPRVQNRQTNEWEDGEPIWLGCRAYGELAVHIDQSLRKGTRVIAQGRLSARSYEDRDGIKRTSMELEVEAIGPELRFATAQVTRSQGGGGFASQGGSAASYYGQPQQASQGYGQPQGQQPPQQQGGWPPQQQAQAQSEWGKPAVPPQQADNPWNQQQQAQGQQQGWDSFDDEKPF